MCVCCCHMATVKQPDGCPDMTPDDPRDNECRLYVRLHGAVSHTGTKTHDDECVSLYL